MSPRAGDVQAPPPPPRHPPKRERLIVNCGVYVGGRRRHDVDTDIEGALREAKESGGFVWIGLKQPTAAEFEHIAHQFQLPDLAVEDAIRAHQRPKLERYANVTFAVIKPVWYVDSEEVVQVGELAVFLGESFVITVRHGEFDVPKRVRSELDGDPQLLSHGPGVVLYRALDLVVDRYLDVISAMGVDVDEIEAQVFGGDRADHAERIYKLKREVLEFRRAVGPLASPLQRLAETEVWGVAPDAREYFRDVYDHVLRASDAIDSYDSLLTNVLQAELAQVSVRQNETAVQQNQDMRKISAWAAIGLVPTGIAGIYGMNFENMPELHYKYSYFVVLAVIVGICSTLYMLFRRNDWL
ncbi:MAG: magnesium and cobalt transport protein CorA [Actinomycetes bacterium]